MTEPRPLRVTLIVTPHFNMAATMAFIDPLRAANYLEGVQRYRWTLVSETGGEIVASNGLGLSTAIYSDVIDPPDIALVSTSWSPEQHVSPALAKVLRKCARFGVALGAIDTGAFVLARLGLLDGHEATVHYEHMDAFAELFPEVALSEALFTITKDRMTCCGGSAATDLALHLIAASSDVALANAAARYVFHERLRGQGDRQLPEAREPLGASVPDRLRVAIRVMEENLEEPIPIPKIARRIDVSDRQLERLFAEHVGASPQKYYRDIRLDRARGFVTQTEMPIAQIALACGFASPEHFSRAYRSRFDVAPSADRIAGRVPFEFRAWPMPQSGRTT